MVEKIAGIPIPDTRLVAEATEVIEDREPPLLFHHSRRVFLFGMLLARHRNVAPDPELLYVGAMFHDLGLTDAYRTSTRRFEVDSADAARAFLTRHGADDAVAQRMWTAVALHTTPNIPCHMAPEVAMVTAGVETDVLGIGYHELDPADIKAVVEAHPRPNFKHEILAAFTHGFGHRPESTFGTVNADVLAHYDPGFTRTDFVDVILDSPWPE